jgi:hypothetical protein
MASSQVDRKENTPVNGFDDLPKRILRRIPIFFGADVYFLGLRFT